MRIQCWFHRTHTLKICSLAVDIRRSCQSLWLIPNPALLTVAAAQLELMLHHWSNMRFPKNSLYFLWWGSISLFWESVAGRLGGQDCVDLDTGRTYLNRPDEEYCSLYGMDACKHGWTLKGLTRNMDNRHLTFVPSSLLSFLTLLVQLLNIFNGGKWSENVGEVQAMAGLLVGLKTLFFYFMK